MSTHNWADSIYYSLDPTRFRRGNDLPTEEIPSIDFPKINDASLTDIGDGQFYCSAYSEFGESENCVRVTVLGKFQQYSW